MKNEEIEKKLASLEERVGRLEEGGSNKINYKNEDGHSKKMAINEFMRTKKLKDDTKRTLAVAYYLDNFERVNTFNIDDLKKRFRLARLSIPANMNDKVNLNIKTGHLAEEKEKKDKKKAWYITNKGIEFVEKELNGGEKD
jgi:hypothetical protein